jgi:hypothetical protein
MKVRKTEDVWGVAVVKVPPPMGSVKYKAQHIVLPLRIPILIGCKWVEAAKIAGFGCGIFKKGAAMAEFTVQ